MPPRRGRPKRWPIAVAVAVVLLVAAVPASQFTAGSLGRDAGVAVADDPNAVLALDGATRLKNNGGTSKKDLVNLTNGFGTPADVTVTLLNSTATYDVCTPSRCSGDTITVTGVPAGGSQLFELEKSGGGSGAPVQYEIRATTDGGVTATIVRTASKSNKGGGGGTPPGQGGTPPGQGGTPPGQAAVDAPR